MATYLSRVLALSPVAHWQMRETAGGSANDETANNLDATITNVTLNSVDSPLYGAEAGKAFSFNGTTSTVTRALDLSAFDKLTLALFLYANAYANSDDLLGEFTANYNSNPGNFILNIDAAGGTFEIYMQAGGIYTGANFPRPSAAAWHHIVVELDRTVNAAGGAAKLWVDGAPQTPTPSGAFIQGGTFANSTLYIGSRAGASLFLPGRMADFSVFGYHLDAGQIADLAAPTLTPQPVLADMFAVASGGRV